ncbi:restriction endonuclease subunit S [uncultured Gilvimarinus sp.]|uniref:restriction endonuclease subunit S n=1 Tax=uncultured Gilvimarinus sp. TaxID=1689143 RepID=UPI0030DD8D87
MGSEWIECSLEDCMEAIIDYRGKTPKKTTSGIPLVTAKIIKSGTINPVAEYIAEEDYDTWMRRGFPKPGDVVMTTEAPLGEIAQLDDRKVALAQRVITLRGKQGVLDNTFLKYLMISDYVQHQLDGRATGTTVKGIKQSELRKIVLKFPPYRSQLDIANILGSMDKKIELNRQTNSTLESIAQGLFKSWFVDFDPVIDNALAAGNPIPPALEAKAEKRRALRAQQTQSASPNADATNPHPPLPEEIKQLFPSSFVFTEELGWVPEGWGIGVFGDIAAHVKNNVKADNTGDYNCYVGLEHIGRKSIFLENHASGESVESNKSEFQKGDLLFGKLRPYFHKVCIAPQLGICSTDILIFRPRLESFHSYMTLVAYSDAFVDYATMRSTGTRMPRASAKDLLAYPVVIPSEDILSKFQELVAPYWLNGIAKIASSDISAELRDRLLPKLLAGDLTVEV